MDSPAFAALLVRLPSGAAPTSLTARRGARILSAAGVRFEVQPLFSVPPSAPTEPGLTGTPGWEWHIARPTQALEGAHAWELAHAALAQNMGLAAAEGAFIEPDLLQSWDSQSSSAAPQVAVTPSKDVCAFHDQMPSLPSVNGRFAWHLDDDFSQLRSARLAIAASDQPGRVRIAHLDTGFDPQHATFPAHVCLPLQRNFMDDQPPNDAHDPAISGVLNNPGHGTATLALLAGKRYLATQGGYQFHDSVGGAPDAEIIPVRVGSSVVQIRTSSVASGIHYAAELCNNPKTAVHVLSMSMGGVASAAWADAVNLAYDAGIVLVTAAGNNFSAGFFGFPTHFIVYPARFRRVIAACGIMASRAPYYDLPFHTMQGNWGPHSKMATAVSAYALNTCWAKLGCEDLVNMDSEGTSTATPQIAAAAALYLQKHGSTLLDSAQYPEPWMRVEAVRRGLFSSADRSADGGSVEKLGNGILQAARALAQQPAPSVSLQKMAIDSAQFPFLRVLTGQGIAASAQKDQMLALEATQLAAQWDRQDLPNALEYSVSDPDLPPAAISEAQVKKFLEAILAHPHASKQLKDRVEQVRRSHFPSTSVPKVAPAQEAKPAAAPSVARQFPFTPPEPVFRELRGFSIDPSLATQLDTAPISEIQFRVPWEKLSAGPAGEYVEVIDIDPASGCFYEPINLDHPALLAQGGLPPSEGTPQFHQQMVYAVSSLTIRNFERALGRRTLWRPGPAPDPKCHPKNDSVFVPRLRIYPHALREQNAYYSPQKIALLFGYFNGAIDTPGDADPGMVFACLSHDIVAHETTHALLDGMHRRFLNATNPDVLAFHEAFADMVALFQHFTFPEIVAYQIAATKGQIRSQQNLLGQLAVQFGRASGLRGALRDAIGSVNPQTGEWEPRKPNPADFMATMEPHARGAILVAAVFDAFLSIYEHRTVDLLRLATGGSGVLQPGAIHPDLVARLSKEAAKSAQHVLTMCIRALDYCPPVDITFGEYLRALITGDVDMVPDDNRHYRISLIEAFRKRGIYPRDLRTLSVESLIWRSPHNDELRPSKKLESALERLRGYAQQYLYTPTGQDMIHSRERLFHLQREMRRDLHAWLKEHFASGSEELEDGKFLGLDPTLPFEVHTARFALRTTPDGSVDPQIIIGLLQDRAEKVDPANASAGELSFEGGSSIIADLLSSNIRYCIRKNLSSQTRLNRQRAFATQQLGSVRSTYFGQQTEPFAALHRGM